MKVIVPGAQIEAALTETVGVAGVEFTVTVVEAVAVQPLAAVANTE